MKHVYEYYYDYVQGFFAQFGKWPMLKLLYNRWGDRNRIATTTTGGRREATIDVVANQWYE